MGGNINCRRIIGASGSSIGSFSRELLTLLLLFRGSLIVTAIRSSWKSCFLPQLDNSWSFSFFFIFNRCLIGVYFVSESVNVFPRFWISYVSYDMIIQLTLSFVSFSRLLQLKNLQFQICIRRDNVDAETEAKNLKQSQTQEHHILKKNVLFLGKFFLIFLLPCAACCLSSSTRLSDVTLVENLYSNMTRTASWVSQ